MDRCLIVFCVLVVSSFADDDPVVQIEDGKIEGKNITDMDGGRILAFLGIPYGKPPLNELRFKDPLPAEPWNGTHNGKIMGNCCFQSGFTGSEDCLNLNVYTKELTPEVLKPVMVWIHGGSFLTGCNKLFGPEFLMTEDIVFVAINYRLGIFGFLSVTNATLGVTGNAGLKDQNLALKWVKKNIKAFGGNPDDVTLFGEDAGGVSTHYHVISEASRGFFHKAIIQSGSVLNPWATVEGNLTLKIAESIRYVGFPEEVVLEHFRYNSYRDLQSHQEEYLEKASVLPGIGPVLEAPNDSQFITESGLDILKSGRYNTVPLMMGYCSNEGLVMEMEKQAEIVKDKLRQGEESHIEAPIPSLMNLQMNHSISSHINRELIETYFEGENAKNKYLLSTDFLFVSGIIGSANLHANTSDNPVYLYRMSLDAGRNYIKRTHKLDDFPGACHGDDLGYLFNMTDLPLGEEEKKYVRTFVKLWTNFAKYGNPTPNVTDLHVEWKPVNEDQYFIDIGENLDLRKKPEDDRMTVWKDMFPEVILPKTNGCVTFPLLSSLIPTLFFLILCTDR